MATQVTQIAHKHDTNQKTNCPFCDKAVIFRDFYSHVSNYHFFDFWTIENEERLRKSIKTFATEELIVTIKDKSYWFCPMNNKIYAKKWKADEQLRGVNSQFYEQKVLPILVQMKKRSKVQNSKGLDSTEKIHLQALIYDLFS